MRSASLIRPIPAVAPGPQQVVARRTGLIHLAILGLVWLAFAVSSIVFTEPAPVDVMLMGLIALLPAAGLTLFSPALAAYLALWSIAAASGFLAATLSRDLAASTIFTVVSLYLYVASFVLAGFIARSPVQHTALIFSGWLFAAVLAAGCAFTGYFQLIPGAYELFTKFARASGTFKDPNVFGPFLVAPFLYALHLVLVRPWYRAGLPIVIAAALALANLLSFSRGAWINLALALLVYGVLAYATAYTRQQREKIVAIVLAGCALVALVTLGVLQNDKMASFLEERASLTQSYDVGPAGRFGGQEKAKRLLLDNPLGIGAGQFTAVHHHEEVHNVFLSMFLNAGWLGGLTYALMVGLTLAIGAKHLSIANEARPLFLIAYAAFVATALEGIIIDSDHWRSFYVLMAMVWGIAAAPPPITEH
ncbi:MAG: O-antigen ligase family protein [Hyphomicrobiaceae bacterium]